MEDFTTENIEFLNSPLTVLKGIGPKKAELFSKLGVNSVLDLVYYLPRGFEDRSIVKKLSECTPGELCCIKIIPIRQVVERRLKSRLSLFLMYGFDGETNVCVKWFSSPFAKPKLKARCEYMVYGRAGDGKNDFEMRYMEPCDQMKYTGRIVPLYPATGGLSSKTIMDTIALAYEHGFTIPEAIPEYILKEYNLCEINRALKSVHNPLDFAELDTCRRRLAFEELFVLQLALFRLRNLRSEKEGRVIYAKDAVIEFASSLPYELTSGQKSAINDICADLKSGKPMNRLVQGDVGCGKTAVAASIMYAVCKSGYQSAFMAPTEILATQHYNTLQKLVGAKLNIALLTSSTKSKKQLVSHIKEGLYDVVVGTHAVIEENVEFKNLSLAVTDEQHRFGVNQRAKLNSKGENIHVLVMSATPIPRTLSLILYGDVDISAITTKPFGRQSIETYHVKTNLRKRAYSFLKKEVEAGRQCYVVCPLVEDSENYDAVSVTEMEELSKTYLSGVNCSIIHGRMKAAEKDDIMNRFKNGEIDVLISTTVIEVGVDVPNATVMLIENAERFGLSQLHQLRGRVGRGEHKSYCILVSDAVSDNSRERMKIMTQSNDGFEISAKDLELRGSGEFFGTRQHGIPELKIANLFSDIEILKDVQKLCDGIMIKDAMLEGDEFVYLKSRIDTLFDSLDSENIFN